MRMRPASMLVAIVVWGACGAALALARTSTLTTAPRDCPSATRDWTRIAPPLELAFPRDHGAHFDVRTEWWYATGELASADGARFGYQMTVFRQGLDPEHAPPGASPLRAKHVFAAHFVVIDLATGELVRAERQRRRIPGLADASEAGLDVRLDGWSFVATGERSFTLHGDDAEHGITLDLELASEKPLVLHGEGGVSRKGDEPGNASAYTSWTRLATRGTLVKPRDHGSGVETLAVTGTSWFDHEWGTTQLGAGVVGWDWFALRFDDGRELMLYRLRHPDGGVYAAASATLVAKDGTWRSIPLERFELAPLDEWKSPATGARYPSRWRLRLAEEHLDVELVPRVLDCEIDGRRSTGVVYWEGPIEVKGSVKGSVSGSGYAELTGYATSLAKRF